MNAVSKPVSVVEIIREELSIIGLSSLSLLDIGLSSFDSNNDTWTISPSEPSTFTNNFLKIAVFNPLNKILANDFVW